MKIMLFSPCFLSGKKVNGKLQSTYDQVHTVVGTRLFSGMFLLLLFYFVFIRKSVGLLGSAEMGLTEGLGGFRKVGNVFSICFFFRKRRWK